VHAGPSIDWVVDVGDWMADCCDGSIREFCELQTPIFMFDKDGAFVVMKLEQVFICLLI
jgi:hypothetical protein